MDGLLRNSDAILGQIVQLMLGHDAYSRVPMRNISVWILPALYHGQIKVIYGTEGNPIAFITWATFSAITASRIYRDATFLPHISEWNEGGNLWIMEVFGTPGSFPSIKAFLRDELSVAYPSISWVSQRRKSHSARIFSRRTTVL